MPRKPKQKIRLVNKIEQAEAQALSKEFEHLLPEKDREDFVARLRQLRDKIFSKDSIQYHRLQQKFLADMARYNIQELPRIVQVQKPVEYKVTLSDVDET
jgi:hypothetical protein